MSNERTDQTVVASEADIGSTAQVAAAVVSWVMQHTAAVDRAEKTGSVVGGTIRNADGFDYGIVRGSTGVSLIGHDCYVGLVGNAKAESLIGVGVWSRRHIVSSRKRSGRRSDQARQQPLFTCNQRFRHRQRSFL